MISANDPFFGALDESGFVRAVGDGFAGGALAVEDTEGVNLGRLAMSEAILRREELEAELLVGLPSSSDPGEGRPFGRECFEGARPLVEGRLVV